MASVVGNWLRIDFEGASYRVPLRVVLHDKAKARNEVHGGGLWPWLRAISAEFKQYPEQPELWLRLMDVASLAPFVEQIPARPPRPFAELWEIGNCKLSTMEPAEHLGSLPDPAESPFRGVLEGIVGWVASNPADHRAVVSLMGDMVQLTASVRGCRKPLELLFSHPERGIDVRNRIRAAFREEMSLASAIELIELDTE